MALVSVVCVANAGEVQELVCGDKSLSYCIKHFDRQCEAKNYDAYNIVGALHDEQEQYSESKKYYELVCDKANSKDSYQSELIDGSLSKKYSAIELMENACYNLANHYFNGWGVRQDKSKALQYYKKACDLGNKDGCENYQRLKNEMGITNDDAVLF